MLKSAELFLPGFSDGEFPLDEEENGHFATPEKHHKQTQSQSNKCKWEMLKDIQNYQD